MTVHELPSMFPAVLDGSCPLDIFADAVEGCGIERLCLREFISKLEHDAFLRNLLVNEVESVLRGEKSLIDMIADQLAEKITP